VPETGTPEEAREQIDSLTKDLKSTQAELETAMQVNREHDVKDGFASGGFDPKFADLYMAANPEGDITADAISEWAGTYGIEPSTDNQSTPSTEPVTDPSTTGLDTMGRGGSNPGGSGQPPATEKTMPIQEWQDLYARDPDAAKQAMEDGRVEVRTDNPYVPGYTQRRNPYQHRVQEQTQ
jgi:hypothetical protein